MRGGRDEFFEARNFSKQNLDAFNHILARADWNSVLLSDSTQEAYTNFSNIFFNLYGTHFPVQRHKFNRNYHKLDKWMSSGILTSRREKIRLEKLCFSEPTPENLNHFKSYRNAYNRIIRAAKKLYFDVELSKNQSNLKKSWQLLKNAINKKTAKSSLVYHLDLNGKIIDNPTEMATLFNQFFTSMPGTRSTYSFSGFLP
jgi:hypothetical protein